MPCPALQWHVAYLAIARLSLPGSTTAVSAPRHGDASQLSRDGIYPARNRAKVCVLCLCSQQHIYRPYVGVVCTAVPLTTFTGLGYDL